MIIQPPVSTIAALGTNATFSCRGTGSVLWQINGTQVRHASQLPVFESMLVYVPLPSDGFSELIVTATNTSLVIICVVDPGIGMGDVVKSDAVQLLVNGKWSRLYIIANEARCGVNHNQMQTVSESLSN